MEKEWEDNIDQNQDQPVAQDLYLLSDQIHAADQDHDRILVTVQDQIHAADQDQILPVDPTPDRAVEHLDQRALALCLDLTLDQ